LRLAQIIIALGALVVASVAVASVAVAHEVRPAYLEIRENDAGRVSVLWKQPVLGSMALPLRPVLSSGWLDAEPTDFDRTDAYLTRHWSIADPRVPLEGQELRIEGLERSLTDVMVRIEFTNGTESLHLIRPDSPVLFLPSAQRAAPPVAHYLPLGIEHIWLGIDHLLFVLGLVLLVMRQRASRPFVPLLQTITAFTLAHSITLAAAATHLVAVPSGPVEAAIALSIVYLAVELVRPADSSSVTAQRPWVVAFAFGLLHGFGFAGALEEVGLPAERIPLALLFFNVGIELGQLVFVAAVLLLLRALSTVPTMRDRFASATPHLIGSLAAFWFIDRTVTALRL
jgi:hypothetical protein